MDLPVMPPVAPMLAKSVKDVPDGPGFLYEPKWDGFRCIVFRDGDEVELVTGETAVLHGTLTRALLRPPAAALSLP